MSSYAKCTEPSPSCPIAATTYGYYPSLPFNALFVAIFALAGLCQLFFGLYFKTYTWVVGLFVGTFLEMSGYIGRIMLHNNPWDANGQKLQIIALVLAPSFIAAAIDLTLKHLVIIFGRKWSRLPPWSYPWIFISADFLAIFVQAIGGSLAAVGATHPNLLKAGDDGIVAGIALQVFQLVVFGAVALEYGHRVYCHRSEISPEALAYARSGKFRFFMTAIILSYVAVLTRCWYRLPEMWNGWGQGLQRDETKFLILDGAMVATAAVALTIAHPGFFFPYLKHNYAHSEYTPDRQDMVERRGSKDDVERDQSPNQRV